MNRTPEERPHRGAPPAAPIEPSRILVVEDDTIVAMMVEQMILDLGFVPVVCVRGEDAVSRAREVRPDLVFMDVKLKGEMNGVEAAEAIRADVPCDIVFMTAYGDPATAHKMRQIAGPNVLGKPLSEPILRLTIRDKLHRRRRS